MIRNPITYDGVLSLRPIGTCAEALFRKARPE